VTLKLFSLLITASIISSSAVAQTPAFDPRSWRGQHVGKATEVLTIGSMHLSELSKPITPEMTSRLLDKLAAFKPDIITHEGISGEQCDHLQRYAARYPGMFDTYCRGTAEAFKATGLDVPAAMAAATKTLAQWPAQPSAAQRRQLAAYFLAAGERSSAQVQWLHLPASERRIGDGIDAALLKILTRSGAKPNETFEVAVPLAVRLGHEKVYAVDDHTADSIQAMADSGMQPALEKHWSSGDFPEAAEYDAHEAAVKDGPSLLAAYRFINSARIQNAFIKFDYLRAMNTASPAQYGRQYLAWWETRNLRMVANIRAAFGNMPGARVLNIVGASHKPYYDAYLAMMSDVVLVDSEAILK
jgi:hypothetical protein